MALIMVDGCLYHSVIASSPPFVRQEIKDNYNDGWNHVKNEFVIGHNFTDLAAISYYSDGKFLNATFFLRSPFVERPSNNYTAYGMLIDADSNYATGWQGYDYIVKISWDHNNNKWIYSIQEWSSVSITRVLYQKNNFTDFFDKSENRYIHMYLDLDKVSSPKNYIVVFFTDYDFQEGNEYYEISDYSNFVHIPPPYFTISTSPNSVTLRPGEEKTVEVEVNSSAGVFRPHLFLSSNRIDDLQAYFTPIERDIPPLGIATSLLHLKLSEHAQLNPRTLQIFANISFPIQYTGGESQIKIISQNMTQNSNLAITVVEPLSFAEQFKEFWITYGGVISLIGGGFGAGFSALVFDKLRKK